jgi:hypothetical protein
LAYLWFLAGILFALACLVLLLPWLRTIPGLGSLPVIPWQAGIGALLIIAVVVAVYAAYGTGASAGRPRLSAAPESIGNAGDASRSMNSLIGAADALRTGPGASSESAATNAAQKSNAGSMNAAIASLQARLAKGGGSADDWELLAKSYDFLGRPDEASKARARRLPALPPQDQQSVASGAAGAATAAAGSASGAIVRGEVSISAGLRDKAVAGTTLFIVAKSIDSPGPPVAVVRTTVGAWPLKFTLDDTQSMLPGRNLTTVGRVTVEARISASGQPLPAAGDLQGSSGPINAAGSAPLEIVIDRIVR